jgi:hypothetical protein
MYPTWDLNSSATAQLLSMKTTILAVVKSMGLKVKD